MRRSKARRHYALTHNKHKHFRFHGKVLITRTWMQRKSKAIHQNSQICLPSYLWILFFMLFISFSPTSCSGGAQIYIPNINLVLPLSHITLDPHTVTLSSTPLNSYNSDLLKTLTLTHCSVLAAIQNTAQKRRRHMPQTIAKRQMFSGSARTNRGVGRLACHRHAPHVRPCEILR